MKITRIELHLIRVPFDMGAAPTAFAGMNLTSVDSLFVRVCTDAGVDGWGEGWGHVACPTTSAALTTLVGPAFIGGDVSDRSRLMTEMSHRFHIHGRMGPVVYALSAIEIALWDIAGKLASLPVASLLGGTPRELTAYASLLRYAEPELVASAVERALSQGFRHIKLHEVRLDTVAAARAACGESVWLALDTNCPWTVSQSIENARALEASRLAWLEEPVWPPEDTPAWRECAPRRRFRSPQERMPPACTTWQRCYGLDRSTSVSPASSRLAASRRWHRRRSWRACMASTTCRTVSTSDRAS
jgi:D-galactarolactone cycloisomerase